jgi:hypothetical protein
MYKVSNPKFNQWMVKSVFAPIVLCLMSHVSVGQVQVPLKNLDFFKDPSKSWSIAGDAVAGLEGASLSLSKGEGILVNNPTKKNPGKDLHSKAEYGDMDLELEYMMAPGSNSGIYLQGRYEIQLLDSWGVANPRSGDNGGIYQRWDDSKPDGQKGYQGYAPRQNVSRAPGLWQQLAISFRAPRFDEGGKKVENARIIQMTLNGVVIHENVELFGPTRGGMGNDEKATGPLRIQGDHGAVAFKNINITSFDTALPELTDLSYAIYEGRFDQQPDFSSLSEQSEGTSDILSSRVGPKPQQFLLTYKGTLHIKEAGEYSFNLNVPGGQGSVTVNGQEALGFGQGYRRGSVQLPVGKVPFELVYSKYMDWVEPGLGLAVAGPGLREFQLTNSNSVQRNEADPILVDPKEKPLLRSFMDVPGYGRVTHAVSIGSEAKVHFSYDLDHGSLFQVWRGEFLNATPMWNNRGDGSSRPLGSVVRLGHPVIPIASLSSSDQAWPADTVGAAFKTLGYQIHANNDVSFKYSAHGAIITDEVVILENGQGVKRQLTIENGPENAYFLLAQGSKIGDVGNGTYLIEDKAYYLKLEGTSKAIIRNVSGTQELVVPVKESLVYTLLF